FIYGSHPYEGGVYSQPNPIVVNPFVPNSAWTSLNLCPATCVDEACDYYSYGPIQPDGSNPWHQVPFTAIVIHDLHDITRVQYLNKGGGIVREVRRGAHGSDSLTTNYTYDENGFLEGVAEPTGIRTCKTTSPTGLVAQKTVLPAPGFAGNAQPLMTKYAYN